MDSSPEFSEWVTSVPGPRSVVVRSASCRISEPVTLSERVPASESKGPPKQVVAIWAGKEYLPSGDSSTRSRTRSLRMTGFSAAPVIPQVGAARRRGGAQGDSVFVIVSEWWRHPEATKGTLSRRSTDDEFVPGGRCASRRARFPLFSRRFR